MITVLLLAMITTLTTLLNMILKHIQKANDNGYYDNVNEYKTEEQTVMISKTMTMRTKLKTTGLMTT